MKPMNMSPIIKLLMIAGVLGRMVLSQQINEKEVARQLASGQLREEFVVRLSPNDKDLERVLIKLRDTPPAGINAHELKIGLADAFGALRTREAIRFLVDNIAIQRSFDANTWLKSAKVIEERLPAARALISIGPDALDALMDAYSAPIGSGERLAIVFTVSRMKDPRARGFLTSVQGEAKVLHQLSLGGLKLLDSIGVPGK